MSYISFVEHTQQAFVWFYFLPAEWGNNKAVIIQCMKNSRSASWTTTVAHKEANTLCLPVLRAVLSVWFPTFVTHAFCNICPFLLPLYSTLSTSLCIFSLILLLFLYHVLRGTRWHSSLRHCATSQKVAGSIPDGVIGIFH